MANRKALLIGAERYGEGFEPLPSVRNDIELMKGALEAAGYETQSCPEEVVTDATRLDSLIREFCRSAGADDIRLVYFTGHGLRVDGADWIVPAGANRSAAAVSANQRVSTDLSATVAESTVGLALFVIDACRDRADVPALDELATKLGLTVQDATVTRGGSLPNVPGSGEPVIDAAFAAQVGALAGPVITEKGAVVLLVEDQKKFDPAVYATEKERFMDTIRQREAGRLVGSMLDKMRANSDEVLNLQLSGTPGV